MSQKYEHIYFAGIGGIGMSALARYFLRKGQKVAGYDRTPTKLTSLLTREGAEINHDDDPEAIPADFRNPATTLVVYTPAVPDDHAQMEWFRRNGFAMVKRAEMLGRISEGRYVMAVAGTHGKTTVTTLTAWLNSQAAKGGKGGDGGGDAFPGGISKNFDSNLVLGTGRRLTVEADEFDRSFLHLRPDAAVITSADPDHLDIYGSGDAMKEAFTQFAGRIKPGGTLILKQGTGIAIENPQIAVYSYSLDGQSDFHARDVTLSGGGYYIFDIVCPDTVIEKCTLGIPGLINVENAVAAAALMWVAGFDAAKLKTAMAEFKGVHRRFDFHINTPSQVYMDDYAHHPRELAAAITSVKAMFPGRKMTAVFQPHLYTRTRDLYREFGHALSLADEVVLLPIYPAREKPIPGITSGVIAEYVTVPCVVSAKESFVRELTERQTDIVVTFGAGDIENHCAEVTAALADRSFRRPPPTDL